MNVFYRLKVLAAIAQIVQNPEFDKKWLEARSKEELKNIILLAERKSNNGKKIISAAFVQNNRQSSEPIFNLYFNTITNQAKK